MGSTDCSLPPADSPNLAVVLATPSERRESLYANGVEWKGRLSADQYIQRESHLMNQQLIRDGGLTSWILVDTTLPVDDRPILSSCESYGRTAFLAYDGKVEDVLAHAVGSVYCRPIYRRRGYASRMLAEVAKKLDIWQQEKSRRKRTVFSVLFSDVGKNFYAQHGWKAFPSSHLELPAISGKEYAQDIPGLQSNLTADMQAEDVKRLMCSDAIMAKYREVLRHESTLSQRAKIAFPPDYAYFGWHWAREEFYAAILFPDREMPKVKGACVENRKVFMSWNRKFGDTEQENVLYILRCLYDEPTSPSEEAGTVEAIAAVLRRAQLEAYEWNMPRVEIWNPTPLTEKAARMLVPDIQQIHREESCICCLKWDGKSLGLGDKVDWCWSERYTWC